VFSPLNFKKLTTMAHGGWLHATAVGHGGCKAASCRRGDTATAVCNRRGDTATTVCNPRCQNYKILKSLYNFAKRLKNI
jgi:hypothetical protein